MAIGEVVLSAFLQAILQQTTTLIVQKVTKQIEVIDNLNKLQDDLRRIEANVKKEEKKPARDEVREAWLLELRDVAYDANDLLDELGTELLRRQHIQDAGDLLSKVRDGLSKVNPKRFFFRLGIAERLEKVTKKINNIKERNRLGGLDMELDGGSVGNEEGETTSLESESIVGGIRDDEAKKVIELLTGDDRCNAQGNICVIPIQGEAGIGKTTLARRVYNAKSVSEYFNRRMWVCVSQDVSVTRLTRSILESLVGPKHQTLENLNNLQCALRDELMEKRYLLVLDNMDCERREVWDELRNPLGSGKIGSRILVTTRSKPAAELMVSPVGQQPFVLHRLSDNDCWSVFYHYAFSDGKKFATRTDLIEIGKRIAKMCEGLPLAARVIGSRLRFESDKTNWESVLKEGIGKLPQSDEILRLSDYQQLDADLKQCFRFCAIFPKGFTFEREVLVRLWMALDFITLPTTTEGRKEDKGARYVDSLVRKSFFQPLDGGQSRYKMCDFVHELGQFVSSGECYMSQLSKSHSTVADTIRHSSLICSPIASPDINKVLEAHVRSLYTTKGLRTLLLVGDYSRPCCMQIPHDLAKNLPHLRVLDLSHSGIDSLNDKIIKELKHLRYLSLSSTSIKKLPGSVCHLYNLQTLVLRNCVRLKKLPKGIKNLSNLWHIDLHLDHDFKEESTSNSLSFMPKDIGRLKVLQTLSRFVVSKGSKGGGLKELNNLLQLHGDLRILDLRNVSNSNDAREANLMNKEFLHRLELQWGDINRSSNNPNQGLEENVFESLKPHTNLKELWVVGYMGGSFPTWMGDASFSRLVKVRLSNCERCRCLPPLGQLQSLKDLHIKGMNQITEIDCGFCGKGMSKGFPSLRKLQFENMQNWKAWSGSENCRLTSVQELVVKDCPKLKRMTHALPSLTKLEMDRCPNLKNLEGLPSLVSLTLRRLAATGDPAQGLLHFTSLKRLEITDYHDHMSLLDVWLPNQLTHLGIRHCSKLLSLPNRLIELDSLQDLVVHDCQDLVSLPEGMRNLISLQRLEIFGSPQLCFLPDDGLPPSLRFFSITNCPMLSKACREGDGQEWHKIRHIPLIWLDGAVVSAEYHSFPSQSYPGQSSRT